MSNEPVPNFLAIFEKAAATPIEGHDSEWISLTKDILKLSLIHIPAVQAALKQGRWRTAKNQRSYIKRVAKREAVNMKLVDDPKERFPPTISELAELADEDGTPLDHDAHIDYLSYGGPVKEGGVWKEDSGFDIRDDDEYTENNEWLSSRERLLHRIPAELKVVREIPADVRREIEKLCGDKVSFSVEPIETIDWKQIAITTVLDEGEQFVLSCKARGISREKALEGETPERRKWIQAAWRRFDRGAMQKLREVMFSKA